MKSGDVRPANVLLNKDGEIKLVNQYSFPNEKTNYYKYKNVKIYKGNKRNSADIQ